MTYHATQRIVFPHKHTPSLSLPLFIPRSTIPVIPDVLMPALLRHPLQPEYMVMSSSPVLRTRCLTGQLDAYSFTKRYLQALSSSLPSPKKALCRPPSQHVRARARGNLGGETRRRRRRFFGLQLSSAVPLSFPLSSSSLSSSHSSNPNTPNPPTKTSLCVSLSYPHPFNPNSKFKNSIHQPPHPQPRTNHTRPHHSDFSRKHPKSRPRTYYRPRLFSELLHSGVVCVCAEGDEDC